MCSENAELHKVQQLTWVNLQEKDIQFPKLTLTIEPVFIAFSSKHLLGLIFGPLWEHQIFGPLWEHHLNAAPAAVVFI